VNPVKGPTDPSWPRLINHHCEKAKIEDLLNILNQPETSKELSSLTQKADGAENPETVADALHELMKYIDDKLA